MPGHQLERALHEIDAGDQHPDVGSGHEHAGAGPEQPGDAAAFNAQIPMPWSHRRARAAAIGVGPGDGGLRFEAERGQAGSGVTAQIVRTGLETGLHPPQALRHRRGRTDHTVAVVLSNLVSEKRRNSSVKGRCSQRHLARR